MPYATATGSNTQDFVDAVRQFAVANGWTQVKWDTTNRLLFLEKGICKVSIGWNVTGTQVAYTQNSTTSGERADVNDYIVKATLATALVPGATNYYGHTGSLVANDTDADRVVCNNLTGPFVDWHLFSNVAGDYIHAVVQAQAGLFTHFGFGVGDKLGMTHGGVAYLSGTNSIWWKDSYEASAAANAYDYNKPASSCGLQFASTGGRQLYVPDALPAGQSFNNVVSVNGTGIHQLVMQSNSDSQWPIYPQNGARLLDFVIGSAAPAWSGQVPLIGIPIIVMNSDSTRAICVGAYPDVRICNMTGLLPGQEITMQGDTWKVFPAMAQRSWGDSAVVKAPSSGQYAVAYKKIA